MKSTALKKPLKRTLRTENMFNSNLNWKKALNCALLLRFGREDSSFVSFRLKTPAYFCIVRIYEVVWCQFLKMENYSQAYFECSKKKLRS